MTTPTPRDTKTIKILVVSVVCLVIAVALSVAFLVVRQHDLDNINDQLKATQQQIINEAADHARDDMADRLAFCEYLHAERPFNPALAKAATDLARRFGCPPS